MQQSSHIPRFDGWNEQIKAVVDNIAEVIVGKEEVVRLLLVALLANGHCLLEDVPGVGKTMLVRATAKTLGCEFKRIQFTPDLLPSDVSGISVYNQKSQAFEFRPGPIFGQIVLADEINRTSPKTQSALLESLEEHSVSADGVTYRLPQPFFVLATENPIEFEGTFPLPEAQLDRFLMKLNMGYPTAADEVSILERQQVMHPITTLNSVTTPDQVLVWQKQATEVHVDLSVRQYIVALVRGTREHKSVYLGASPRASIALFKAAQALALIVGRSFVVPDDVRALAPHVLSHRILLSADARLSGVDVERVISDVVTNTAVPVLHGVRG